MGLPARFSVKRERADDLLIAAADGRKEIIAPKKPPLCCVCRFICLSKSSGGAIKGFFNGGHYSLVMVAPSGGSRGTWLPHFRLVFPLCPILKPPRANFFRNAACITYMK